MQVSLLIAERIAYTCRSGRMRRRARDIRPHVTCRAVPASKVPSMAADPDRISLRESGRVLPGQDLHKGEHSMEPTHWGACHPGRRTAASGHHPPTRTTTTSMSHRIRAHLRAVSGTLCDVIQCERWRGVMTSY